MQQVPETKILPQADSKREVKISLPIWPTVRPALLMTTLSMSVHSLLLSAVSYVMVAGVAPTAPHPLKSLEGGSTLLLPGLTPWIRPKEGVRIGKPLQLPTPGYLYAY